MPNTDTPASLISKFFGKKDGQTIKDFMEEFKALTDQDKEQLAEGIRSGALTY